MSNTHDVVAQWRASADLGNPAGPLFIGGEFAEADITETPVNFTKKGCSSCTGSVHVPCC